MPFWTAWGPLSTFRPTFAKGSMCSSGWSTPGPPLAAGTPRPFLLPPGHSGLARTATKPILVRLSDPIQLLQTCQTGEGRVHFRGFLSNPLQRSNVLRNLTRLHRQNFFVASPQPVPAPALFRPNCLLFQANLRCIGAHICISGKLAHCIWWRKVNSKSQQLKIIWLYVVLTWR